MIADYHLHTEFSGDSITPVTDQIDRAIALGMKTLCITDHHDYDVESDIDFTLDCDLYFNRLLQLKELYSGKIDLCLGIELGLQVSLKQYFDELLSKYPLDFVIGSTHFLERRDPFYPSYFKELGEAQVYMNYFKTTVQNLQNLDNYDVAGHIDYIVRYGPNLNRYYDYETYKDVLDAILNAVIEKGKGIECNTAGYRKGLNLPNPQPDVIKRYRELGGEIITLGSDAHIPGDVGSDFKRAGELLQACGFSHYATFKNRKPVFHKL